MAEIDETDFDPDYVPGMYHDLERTLTTVDDNPAAPAYGRLRVFFDDGFSWGPPAIVSAKDLKLGQRYILSFVGKAHPYTLVGVKHADAPAWLWRLPQETIDAKARVVPPPSWENYGWGHDRRSLAMYESALPAWLRNRLEFFRACSPIFALEYWHLEIEVCVLALDLVNYFQDYGHIPDRSASNLAILRHFDEEIRRELFVPRSPLAEHWRPSSDQMLAAWHLAADRIHDPEYDAAGSLPAFPTANGEYYQ